MPRFLKVTSCLRERTDLLKTGCIRVCIRKSVLGGIVQNLIDKVEKKIKAHLNYIYKRIFVNFNGFMYFFFFILIWV